MWQSCPRFVTHLTISYILNSWILFFHLNQRFSKSVTSRLNSSAQDMAENCYFGQVGSYFAFSRFDSKMTRKIKSRENVRQNIGFGLVIFVKYAIFKWSTCYRYQSEITCWDKNELMLRMVYVGVFTYDLEWNTYRGIDDQNCIFEHIVFCVCNITGVNLIRWTRYLIRLSLH